MFKSLNIYAKALIISLAYVGLGTLAVCSVYPDDPFSGQWSVFVLVLTLPVTVISFGYRFTKANILYPVFIIQFIMFLIMFGSLIIYYRSRIKKKHV